MGGVKVNEGIEAPPTKPEIVMVWLPIFFTLTTRAIVPFGDCSRLEPVIMTFAGKTAVVFMSGDKL